MRGLKMLNSQLGYAVGGPDWGGQGNPYILKTTDGGAHWTRLTLPDFVQGWQGGIDCLSTLHCLSVGTTGQAIRTTDGGLTWANSGMANGYGGYLYTAYWANSRRPWPAAPTVTPFVRPTVVSPGVSSYRAAML
ncbi:MAG: hypothetical protein HZY76_17365 [Anaerolineae bacterium]|nr:MAG: hypothetical protein HZY76_17365 [Anaerolineae bacterium]